MAADRHRADFALRHDVLFQLFGCNGRTVVRLYHDLALWNRINQSSITFVENAWGAESAWGNLAEILIDLD